MSHYGSMAYLDFVYGSRIAQREFIQLLLRQGSATLGDVAASSATLHGIPPEHVGRFFEKSKLVKRTRVGANDIVWHLSDVSKGAAWLADNPELSPLTIGGKLAVVFARTAIASSTSKHLHN